MNDRIPDLPTVLGPPSNGVRRPGLSQPEFVLPLTLREREGGTFVTWEQLFADASIASALCPIVEPANEQNLAL